MNGDPYVQDNGVMINLLGLSDGRALAKAEANLTRRRIFQLLKSPLAGTFDFTHLCEIHKAIFQDIYPWAGQPRTVRIAKSGSEFAHPAHIESSAKAALDKIAQQRMQIGNDRGKLLNAITDAFSSLNKIHPAREGNGRVLMVFLSQLAQEHGHILKWENVKRDMLIATSIFSFSGNDAPLRSMLDSIMHPKPPTLSLTPSSRSNATHHRRHKM